ncbi:hypothetical protein [Paenibacillus assamensis]|uniref:hypothetical protein n=1 Tax=Paenibacillus assamensis TaxID=311244 RepID=UPI00048B7B40|nr:hypothetical protein [Paenibacillus assamensis]
MDYYKINLNSYYNNNAFTYEESSSKGDLTSFGSSYPAEYLPNEHEITVNGIPFIFPTKENKFNNIELENQSIIVPDDSYSTIYILGSSENGSYKEYMELRQNNDLKSRNIFALTDWISNYPMFMEQVAFECGYVHTKDSSIHSLKPKIWIQTLHLDPATEFNTIRLPDNPCIHIFSLTLQKVG